MSKKELKEIFYDFFKNCKKVENSNDEYFCREFINSIQEFFENGTVETVDSGTIGSSAFTGTGKSFELNGDVDGAYSLLLPNVKLLNSTSDGGNYILANSISDALNLFFSNSTIKCNVIGNIGEGTSFGFMNFDTNSILKNDLYSLFMQMNVGDGESIEEYESRLNVGDGRKYEDLDEFFSDALSTKIKNLMEDEIQSVVMTIGENDLSSVSGIGSWKFD